MSKFLRLSLVALMIAAMSIVASAQSTLDGAIGGTINDPNGAVVPNAAVAVKNQGTNKEATATTDSEGRFQVVQLSPGSYTITITAAGFGVFTQSNITVEVGRTTSLDIPLSVEGVGGAQVDVTAEAPVINTTQQDFSTNINQTSINELPINGRRWSNFALLTPAASLDGTFGLISFRGISGLLNNNTVDGGDNNQAFFSEERGRTRISYVVSQAAIREFQVNTSNYSAEYGRAAGGVVNAVTKSGTNEFHGSVFYYQRNNKWGARNPLATRTVLVNGVFTPVGYKPEDVRHQFGGTIGGPIVKDKFFFFFSYDQQKRNFPGLAIFSSNTFLNSANRTALLGKGLTNAQIDSTLAFLASLSGEVPRRGDQTLYLPKIDWNINSSNTFTASYNRLRWDSPAGIQTQATNTRARDNFGDDFVEVDNVNLRLTSTITPNLLNEARYQWSRDLETQFSQAPLPGEPTNSPGGRSPQVFIQNGFSFGKPEFLERGAFPNEKRHQFADTVTLTRGSHTFKFGGDINRVKEVIQNLRFEGGEFNYTGNNGINDFILDYVNFRTPINPATTCVQVYTPIRTVGRCYAGNYNQGFGVTGLEFSTTDVNLFFQDDFRVTSKMTLNLGIRWEYQMNPDQGNPNPALPQTNNIPNDKNNFGPRIGLAYDITGDGKTSVRAGYGIYYGRLINSTLYSALINTGIGIDRAQRQVGISGAVGPAFPNLIGAGALIIPAVQHFAPNFALPQIYQYDLILEREIARNTVISFSFVGSQGRRLPTFVDTNLGVPTTIKNYTVTGGPFNGASFSLPQYPLTRPNLNFAQITEIRSSIKSDYAAMVIQANRRFTNGLQFQVNYTFSKSTDTGQSSTTFTANNVPLSAFDTSFETGRSNTDSPHKIAASAVWTPTPFGADSSGAAKAIFNGWTIAPVFYAFSGSPYSGGVSVSSASAGIGPGLSSVNRSGGANRYPMQERNAFRRPKIVNFDLRLSRRFSLSESMKLELLAEGFNLMNRTQITNVNSTLYNLNYGTGNFAFSPTFQTVTETGATLFRERQVQLAARFEF